MEHNKYNEYTYYISSRKTKLSDKQLNDKSYMMGVFLLL